MQLYDYFRSSAAYRVRIALNLKELDYTALSVNLRSSEQQAAPYTNINPQALVPTLLDKDAVLNQSLAICEYLEEVYPQPALLPKDPAARARVRAIAQTIACDIHPLNNLRVLNYLTKELQVSEAAKTSWYHHWVAAGFTALEAQVQKNSSEHFCCGDQLSLADVFLIPQLYNAHRFACDLSAYPKLLRIEQHCLEIPAFQAAAPEKQADAI